MKGAYQAKNSLLVLALFLLAFSSLSVPLAAAGVAPSSSSPIKHVVIIVQENHTFDNYFGSYPGVNGLNNYTALPAVAGGPATNKPYLLQSEVTPKNLCNTWVCAHEAYDNGSMDGFVTAQGSNLTLGHYDGKLIPYYWDYASQYVLLDNFYTPIFTSSLPNHLYLVAGQSGALVINSKAGSFNFNSDSINASTFYFKSMPDELTAAHITWKYYAGGSAALNNWNPLPAFASFENNQSMMANLAEPSQFASDVANNQMPSVSWIMPASEDVSEEPPNNITLGERTTVSTINTIMDSQYWNSTAIFLTWDDWGGWYDHVPPPHLDSFGDGFRVPLPIISPYAKQGFVDHTQGDFTSTLKFIETVFHLPSLTSRDASASNLMDAFDFSRVPRPPLALPGPFMPNRYPLTFPNGTALGSSSSTTTGSTTVTSAPAVSVTTTTTMTVTTASTVSVVQSSVSTRTIYSVYSTTSNAGSTQAPLGWLVAGGLAVVCVLVLLVSRRPTRVRDR